MKPLNIPVVGMGPGSQPAESYSHELDYPVLPKDMDTYIPPPLPEADDVARCPEAMATLDRLLERVQAPLSDTAAEFIDVHGLGAEDLALINQVLGEGEVSIRLYGEEDWLIQESVFAGVWRVRRPGAGVDRIEIGAIPSVVLEHALADTAARVDIPEEPPAQGVGNGHALLVELAENQASRQPGPQAHVVNLSLLPHTPEDIEYLDGVLGQGHTLMLSRGYGNCRITATGVAHIWWVQYFNSLDAMILNTLEVVAVPSVALAAREDLEDSAARLREVLETMR